MTATTNLDRSQIEEIKEKLPIEQVVGKYVKLKQVGKNLFGICPFHQEDTPSFSVSPELNIYKCYGCGEGGDIFSFIQKIEGLEFKEALEQLAQDAGVKLKLNKLDSKVAEKYQRAKEAHLMAAEYFHYILTKHDLGSIARDYAKQRELTKELISEFKIGYAPQTSTKDSLIKYLTKKKFKPQELIEFGLAVDRYGKVKDKFSDRLMFPIFDPNGKIIGFSGRVINNNNPNRPKYLNTSETLIFQKRLNLFGLYQSKKEIMNHDFTILFEGQTDVISSRKTKFSNTVAPLGTGLTKDQLNKLKRYSNNLTICFDNDRAGILATKRAAEMGYELGFDVKVAQIPTGKDADEAIKKDPKAWEKSVENNQPAVTHFFNLISQKYNPQTLQGKQKIIEILAPLISKISNQVIRDHHIKQIASYTDINQDIIRKYIKTQTEEKKNVLKKSIRQAQKNEPDEKYFLAVILQYPEYLEYASHKIKLQNLHDPTIKKIYSKLTENLETDFKALLQNFEEVEKKLSEDCIMQPIWHSDPAKSKVKEDLENVIYKILITSKRTEISNKRKEISKAENENNSELANKLTKEIDDLMKQLEQLKLKQENER